jgi:hypothetical protein
MRFPLIFNYKHFCTNIFEVNSLNNLDFDSTVYNIFFIVKVLIGQIMSGRIYI